MTKEEKNMFVESNSIYDLRLGYPLYYPLRATSPGEDLHNGYLPPTPPYFQNDHQLTTSSSASNTEDSVLSSSPMVYPQHQQRLVYPHFPSPPPSVSPGLRFNTPSPCPSSETTTSSENPTRAHIGDSFQIKRLLNLSGQNNHQANLLAMRSSSVIMKVEDQRVFQVDSTTNACFADEESSFDQHHSHHQHHHQYISTSCSSSPSGASGAVPATETIFICKWEKCYKVFCHLNDLASHVTQAHGSAPVGSVNYYCRWEGCPRTDRGFNARYKMLVHIRTHTKEKPHQCPQCHKSFSRAENLKIHIRSHSGEKPYVCPVIGCNKAYSNSSDRFKHTRTHSMTKPYQCKVPGCHKRYTDPSSLRKHVKTYKHKTSGSGSAMPDELLMQERITSTSDEMDEDQEKIPVESEMGYYEQSPTPVPPHRHSIDQQMTDLGIHERHPYFCEQEKLCSNNGGHHFEDRLKMYRFGTIFNAHCDVLVSSSSSIISSSGRSEPSDIDAPLDLRIATKVKV